MVLPSVSVQVLQKKNCLSGSAFSLYDFEELISLNVGDL